MREDRFDRLIRRVAAGASRRSVVRAVAAAIGAVAGGAGAASVGKSRKKACKKTTCGNKCVDTRTDRKNCGRCGKRCTGQTTCSGGRCRCADANHVACGKRCVDARTDPKHCGGCGNACPGDLTCSGGTCRCDKVACLVAEWDNYGGPAGAYWAAGLAVAGQHLFVVDSDNNRVLTFTTSGEFVKAWGRFGVDDGEFQRPTGIAIGGDGNVYVADTDNSRIQRFTKDGAFIDAWAPDEIGYPNGIAVTPAGDVCVADFDLVVLDAHGAFVRSWDSVGPDGPSLNADYQVAVDSSGHVYVPDAYEDTVTKFTLGGEVVWSVGETGDEPGEFNFPTGVAIDRSGRILVADGSNDRIQVLDDAGEFLFAWRAAYPEWLAVGDDGAVYVSNGSVSTFVLGSGAQPADRHGSPREQN